MNSICQRILLLGAALLPLAAAPSAQEHRVRVGLETPRATFSLGLGRGPSNYNGRLKSYPTSRVRRVARSSRYGRVNHSCRWRTERVWIDGGYQRVWIDPVFETRYDGCGRAFRVQVCAGYWSKVFSRGHWSSRRVKVCCG